MLCQAERKHKRHEEGIELGEKRRKMRKNKK